MAKEKADSDKRGWFARWRERRKQSKLRASERQRRVYEERLNNEVSLGRHVPPPGGYGGG
jgi:hypothetical protein